MLNLQHSLTSSVYDRFLVLPCHAASCRYLFMAPLDLLNKVFTVD